MTQSPALEVCLVDENKGIVVVNKPSSMPVHPCGKFRHNSVVYTLAHLHGIFNAYVVHRIDRPTSGLLLLALTQRSARDLSERLQTHQLQKHYLARVQGRFPSNFAEYVDTEKKEKATAAAVSAAESPHASAETFPAVGSSKGSRRTRSYNSLSSNSDKSYIRPSVIAHRRSTTSIPSPCPSSSSLLLSPTSSEASPTPLPTLAGTAEQNIATTSWSNVYAGDLEIEVRHVFTVPFSCKTFPVP